MGKIIRVFKFISSFLSYLYCPVCCVGSLCDYLCRGQAEREFKVEVEAIGRVRHKNLVRLLGYCAEGAHRYFVI